MGGEMEHNNWPFPSFLGWRRALGPAPLGNGSGSAIRPEDHLWASPSCSQCSQIRGQGQLWAWRTSCMRTGAAFPSLRPVAIPSQSQGEEPAVCLHSGWEHASQPMSAVSAPESVSQHNAERSDVSWLRACVLAVCFSGSGQITGTADLSQTAPKEHRLGSVG